MSLLTEQVSLRGAAAEPGSTFPQLISQMLPGCDWTCSDRNHMSPLPSVTTQQNQRIGLSLSSQSQGSSVTPSLEASSGGDSWVLLSCSVSAVMSAGWRLSPSSCIKRSAWIWGEHQTSTERFLLSSLIWVLKIETGLLLFWADVSTVCSHRGFHSLPL